MPFLTHLVRQTHIPTANKRSMTLPVIKKKKEIGDYVLGKTIGRGASGRVKLGIHKHTGERVAIKMISRSHLLSSSTTSKSVQRELAVLQLLHHPNLVDLYQVLQDSSYVYFVMEYLEGGELFHYLAKRGRLDESEARLLFIQLITALNWCHAHHISHRDLKPENILLDKENKKLKIADFGMAALQPYNTLLKTSCGSPHYASPEIVKGKRYHGSATDVWSCGVILYAIMTGHLPFDDEHMGRLLAKIKTGKYRALPDSLSVDLKDLIQRMLLVDPHQRMTMPEILAHPWLNNQSFLGTELRFLQPSKEPFKLYPLHHPDLQRPMHASDLEGKIWETLKVLWRGSEQELLSSLSSEGANVQKLTCKLLQERFMRLDDSNESKNNSSVSLPLQKTCEDLSSSPPGLESMDSCLDSFDTLPYLPPTPTSTFQVNREPQTFFLLKQREIKAEVADFFVMTKAIDSTFKPTDPYKVWQMRLKEPSWWEKACDYFKHKLPEKVVSIECMAKLECEVAGKLHQVLEECFRGRLSGRMYPYKKIVWNGMIETRESSFEFTCQMNRLGTMRMNIDFMLAKGELCLFESCIKDLVDCLNKYETESDWVTRINGWNNNHIVNTVHPLD